MFAPEVSDHDTDWKKSSLIGTDRDIGFGLFSGLNQKV